MPKMTARYDTSAVATAGVVDIGVCPGIYEYKCGGSETGTYFRMRSAMSVAGNGTRKGVTFFDVTLAIMRK